METTDHILQFSPASALYWFLNAAANFNLGNVKQAESGATRGLSPDGEHKVPQLEFLYAMILARRQQYNSAIQHLETYLRLSPQAKDAQEAERRLSELQKLAQAPDQATP